MTLNTATIHFTQSLHKYWQPLYTYHSQQVLSQHLIHRSLTVEPLGRCLLDSPSDITHTDM